MPSMVIFLETMIHPFEVFIYYICTLKQFPVAHPFWFVGPPLIYFSLDLCLAMFLHFALRNEVRISII